MEWRKIIRHLMVVEHKTKKKACKIVEEKFNVPSSTVAAYTAPSSYRPPSQNKNYNAGYVKTKRHIDKILPQVFKNNPELPLKQISNGIDKLAGVYIKEKTLEKILTKYEGNPRGLPIVKTETGNYRLNDLFYKN